MTTEQAQFARMISLTRRAVSAAAPNKGTTDIARKSRFFDWARNGNLVADREPIDFRLWRYLRPIYEAVPTDPTRLDLVVMKSAQGGASTLAMLFALWLALRSRSQIAYFLPTEALARKFSNTRFLRMIRGNRELHALMGDKQDPRRRRIANEGSAATRQILDSIIHFTHIDGRITTEALPLDSLIFDEVQEMALSDMERAVERMSASALQAILRVSTATYPGANIDYFFQGSDQREFHSRCRCPDGVVLSDHFDAMDGPACIGRGNSSTPGVPADWFYFCPRCNTVITDPQDGEFRPRNPGARRIGFHFPQLLSPRVRPIDILDKWDTRLSTQNFFNRVLGRPYADPRCLPITRAHLEAAQNAELKWGPLPPRVADTTVMGIDHMGGVNYVVIKGQVDGRMRLLHLEIIQDEDPWKRCSHLMAEYRVKVAVVENLPNFNEAHRFARQHPGRAFIATYQQLSDEMLRWSDRPRDPAAVRYTHDDIRSPWTVIVDQYKMMSWSLARWAERQVQTPDARTLSQRMRTSSGWQTVQVCRDVFWDHLQRVALVTEPIPGRENERVFRSAVRKVGLDPHFAYANMLADVAWARHPRLAQILFEPTAKVLEVRTTGSSPERQQIEDALPWLFHKRDPSLNCGNCTHFDPGRKMCAVSNWLVEPALPSCEFYDPQPDEEDDDY